MRFLIRSRLLTDDEVAELDAWAAKVLGRSWLNNPRAFRFATTDGWYASDMSSEKRWHVIPRTPTQCLVNLVVGLALAVQALIVLNTATVNVPALEVVVAVLGCVLVLCAVVGLAAPRLRGR